MADKDKIKMAVIAGASYALKYQERNPGASDSQVMNHVSENLGRILSDIEENS
jgi:hypothetical protein